MTPKEKAIEEALEKAWFKGWDNAKKEELEFLRFIQQKLEDFKSNYHLSIYELEERIKQLEREK